MREVQDLLAANDLAELDLAVSQLQEALYGLNRRLASERKVDSNPLQGLKNTLGSLKDELFSDDDWDEWDRGGRSRDPWAEPAWSAARSERQAGGGGGGWDRSSWDQSSWERPSREQDRWQPEPPARWEREPEPEPRRYGSPQRVQSAEWDDPSSRYGEPRREPRPSRPNDDPWAED
jgi:molecular chaperone DnaK